jgi:4-alpha-glucanotransferase
MNDRAAIVELAGLLGIAAHYTDAFGQGHEVSNETLLALIEAFGLPPDPTLARQQLSDWERKAPLGLDPVHVVPAEATNPELELRLPSRCQNIIWRCRLENGEERSGRLAVPLDAAGERFKMPLPTGLPLGYHRLEIKAARMTAQVNLIVAPARCYLPKELAPNARSWGLTCQLYGLRSTRNWGIGDFSDLARLAGVAGSCSASTLGINPLHALFAAEPLHSSPYSPSSRLWLNFLYIDVTAVPGFAEDETVRGLTEGQEFAATLGAARSAELVDYGAVAACKRPVLEALFRRFRFREFDRDGNPTGHLGKEFRNFQQKGGQALADFAIFEALHARHNLETGAFSWRDWPLGERNPRSTTVAEFAAAQREHVEFSQYLQWEADRQLAAATAAGREAGLSLGVYRDLAVGADPNGAEAWADQELVTPAASIGAPPDAFNRAGQNWGLAPVNPIVLRRQCYAPFIASLRANMRHAGVLRIDHVMSLNRLYWIPSGMEAKAGAYVTYPFDDLLRLVALESHRQGCAVIGEDLGTVPTGFRETMLSADMLSYRVLVFERRQDRSFLPPAEYLPLAAASAATHDMATLKGFWLGRDLAWRRRLDLYPDPDGAEAAAIERSRDRHLLLDALVKEGLFAPERLGRFFPEDGEPVYSAELAYAILAYLARSRARLLLAQLEDVVGESEQANLPGTTEEHPNWRRRTSRLLEEIVTGGDLQQVAAVLREWRLRAAAE